MFDLLSFVFGLCVGALLAFVCGLVIEAAVLRREKWFKTVVAGMRLYDRETKR